MNFSQSIWIIVYYEFFFFGFILSRFFPTLTFLKNTDGYGYYIHVFMECNYTFLFHRNYLKKINLYRLNT